MKLNTNSNTYTLIYASALVVVVAFLLAFVYQALKPMQDANVQLDTMKHKLYALNIRKLADADIVTTYNKMFVKKVNEDGIKYEIFQTDGKQKYLITMKGHGLWGGISGYIAVNDDKNTIFGADFQHEGETAGLGALITEEWFQKEFCGKKIFTNESDEVILSVSKKGTVNDIDEQYVVDGITGATLTSNGVNEMIKDNLKMLKKIK